MKDKNRAANQVLADMMFFDFLKEKVGERKTKTGAYYDLLEKATAGFIAPFLKNHEYVLQNDQCHVTISDLAVEWHWHRATVRAFLDKLEEMGYIRRTRFAKSVVITVTFAPFSSGETTASYTGHTGSGLADDLDKALSEWIMAICLTKIWERFVDSIMKPGGNGLPMNPAKFIRATSRQ